MDFIRFIGHIGKAGEGVLIHPLGLVLVRWMAVRTVQGHAAHRDRTGRHIPGGAEGSSRHLAGFPFQGNLLAHRSCPICSIQGNLFGSLLPQGHLVLQFQLIIGGTVGVRGGL